MKIILALLIFSLIVVFHELGHFLLAKKNGITVTEFSLGMGPRLLSHVWGETRYSIKLLPFGGSCLMVGEDEDSDDVNAFNNKPVGARIAVVAAGPVFNFILAFILSLFIVGSIGYDAPVVWKVTDGFPAQEAGIEAGDTILRLNHTNIHVYREVTLFVQLNQKNADAPVEVTYRDGETGENTDGDTDTPTGRERQLLSWVYRLRHPYPGRRGYHVKIQCLRGEILDQHHAEKPGDVL